MSWSTDNLLGIEMPITLGYILYVVFGVIVITASIVNIFWIVYLSYKSYVSYKMYRRIEPTDNDPEEQHRKWSYRVDTWKFGFLSAIATLEFVTVPLVFIQTNVLTYTNQKSIFNLTQTENCTDDNYITLLYDSIWKISYLIVPSIVCILSLTSLISFLTIFLFRAYSNQIWEFKRERRIFKLFVVQIAVVSLLCIFPYTYYLGLVLTLICISLHICLFIRYSVKIYNCLQKKLFVLNDRNDPKTYALYKKQKRALKRYKIVSFLIQPAMIALMIMFIFINLLRITSILSYSLCRSEIYFMKISNEQLQATRRVEGQLQVVHGVCLLLASAWFSITYTVFSVYFILDYLFENRWKRRMYRFKPMYEDESDLQKGLLQK